MTLRVPTTLAIIATLGLLALAPAANAKSSLAHRVALLEKTNRIQQQQIGRLALRIRGDDNLIDALYERVDDLTEQANCTAYLSVDVFAFAPVGLGATKPEEVGAFVLAQDGAEPTYLLPVTKPDCLGD